jgi:hypothetical protein
MLRRIWIAEGIATDGDFYGRALQLPDGDTRHRSPSQGNRTDVQRTRASILKSHLGDVPSCPCLSLMMPQDFAAEPSTGEVTNA